MYCIEYMLRSISLEKNLFSKFSQAYQQYTVMLIRPSSHGEINSHKINKQGGFKVKDLLSTCRF